MRRLGHESGRLRQWACRWGIIVLALWGLFVRASTATAADKPKRPNVLLIVSDDQGWGDVGIHGNDKIHTPTLDRLAAESTELTRFYVSPVCAPTRACLLTGRYNYRTGVTDTYMGRAMMNTNEVTLAELLRGAGYRTGIFGKWHLGDNFPMRPMEQGFDTALVHTGGGMAQPGDPPQGNGYFNSWVERNGKTERLTGYCSDAFAGEAIKFIDTAKEPWFVYLPFNAPHTPLEVPAADLRKYKDSGLDDVTARIYAMLSNIDHNVGRVLDALKKKGEADNTIVIYFNDNGPQQQRFNGVLRGKKGNVYDGGIRAMCFVRWPGHLAAGAKFETPTAHIDMLPTLAAACDVALPKDLKLDGVNLLPVLTEQVKDLPTRKIFTQWHRGEVPQQGRNCAVIEGPLKLEQPLGMGGTMPLTQKWELYDLATDPGESHDLSKERPQEVARLRAAYDAWFADVSSTRGYAAPRIILGDKQVPHLLLSWQDMREVPQQAGTFKSDGYWAVTIAPRKYDVIVHFDQTHFARQAELQVGDQRYPLNIPSDSKQVIVEDAALPSGDQELRFWLGPFRGPKGLPIPRMQYVEVFAK